MQRLIRDDLEFVPALHKERIEQQYHDGLNQKIEEDQVNSIHPGSNANREAGHASKNNIGCCDAQKCLQYLRVKEGREKKQERE